MFERVNNVSLHNNEICGKFRESTQLVDEGYNENIESEEKMAFKPCFERSKNETLKRHLCNTLEQFDKHF